MTTLAPEISGLACGFAGLCRHRNLLIVAPRSLTYRAASRNCNRPRRMVSAVKANEAIVGRAWNHRRPAPVFE
jgi:hypothetical protein